MWQVWTNCILGLWLAISPFVSMDFESAKINNLLVGLTVAVVSWYTPKIKIWQRYILIILGTWIFIASLIPTLFEGSGYLWNNLIAGLLIAIIGIASGNKITETSKG